MNIKSIDWFQSAQLLAIIVGIFLVAYELRQARDISQAQVASDAWALESDQMNAWMGEDGVDADMEEFEVRFNTSPLRDRIRRFRVLD